MFDILINTSKTKLLQLTVWKIILYEKPNQIKNYWVDTIDDLKSVNLKIKVFIKRYKDILNYKYI